MAPPRSVMAAIVLVLGLVAAGARPASASCGTDSDCAGVGKCTNGQCGACGTDSDCNGHGKCSGGKCGACGMDSDCKVGKCSSGRCGSCGMDSDCRGNGKCSSGQCGSCGTDSDCKVGKCSSGKCGSCGTDSDCKGGRCATGRCSNALGAGLAWFAPEEPAQGGGAGCGMPGATPLRLLISTPALSCRLEPRHASRGQPMPGWP